MKAYEEHCAKNGKPASHAKAKEIMYGHTISLPTLTHGLSSLRAAIGGAFIDRLVETKGLDALDAHKAKEQGKELAI